jgi:hypothetical protein
MGDPSRARVTIGIGLYFDETFSDANTGYYEFTGVPAGVTGPFGRHKWVKLTAASSDPYQTGHAILKVKTPGERYRADIRMSWKTPKPVENMQNPQSSQQLTQGSQSL